MIAMMMMTYMEIKRIIPPDGFPVLELQPLSEIHKSKEAAAAARKDSGSI